MANQTVEISVCQAARVDSNNPNTHSAYSGQVFNGKAALFGYSNQEAEFWYRRFISANPVFGIFIQKIQSEYAEGELKGYDLLSRFDDSTVTWNTKPATGPVIKKAVSGYGHDMIYPEFNITDIAVARNILQNGFQVDGDNDFGVYASSGSSRGNKLKITYDNTPVALNVTLGQSRTVYKESASIISWVAEPATTDTLYPVKQSAVKLKWKTSSSGTVHEISQSGASTSITIPAGTFSTSTVMIQLEVTALGDAVTTTSWYTFNVLGPVISDESPKSGFVNEQAANTFSWNIKQDGTGDDLSQQVATFYYKYSASGTQYSISAGTNKYIVVPANTFSGNTVMWKVSATTTRGNTVSSPWYTLTTVEAQSSAVALSPRSEAVNGEISNVFSWAHVIATGTMQTKFDLQISQNLSSWSTIKSATQSETVTTIPADTLPGGVVYWRVRTYNSDLIAGEWSDPVQIIVISAPDPPGISVTSAAPKWAIQWSQTGQQGYEIEFDGKLLYSGYGTETAYTYDEYAENGSHTVRVRIQNQYSMWSEWASAAISITNVAPGTLALSVAVSENAPEVNLTASGEAAQYWFFRDGKLIAKSNSATFTDRFANGPATYKVIGTVSGNGNYSPSNTVSVDVNIKIPWMYSLKTRAWVPLRMSEAETNAAAQNLTTAAAFLHFSGSSKPFVEFGEPVDRIVSVAVGFLNDSPEKTAFLAMFGSVVCLKLPDGDVIVGALSRWERKHGRIYTEYSTKVVEVEFDEVDANE